MEFVSPEYEAQLNALAEQLVTPERFADQAPVLGKLVLLRSPEN